MLSPKHLPVRGILHEDPGPLFVQERFCLLGGRLCLCQLVHAVRVIRRGDLFLDLPDLRQVCRIVPGGIRDDAGLEGLFLVLQVGAGFGDVQRHIAGSVHVGNVVLQFIHHFTVRRALQLTDADGVPVGGLAETVEQPFQEGFRIGDGDSGGLVHDGQVLRIPGEVPLDTVDMSSVLETYDPAVCAVPEPGFIARVEVIPGGAPAGALHAVEHGAEKCVQRGFSGLVSAVENVHSVGKLDLPVVEFTEASDGQVFQDHFFPLLSSVVRSRALTP